VIGKKGVVKIFGIKGSRMGAGIPLKIQHRNTMVQQAGNFLRRNSAKKSTQKSS